MAYHFEKGEQLKNVPNGEYECIVTDYDFKVDAENENKKRITFTLTIRDDIDVNAKQFRRWKIFYTVFWDYNKNMYNEEKLGALFNAIPRKEEIIDIDTIEEVVGLIKGACVNVKVVNKTDERTLKNRVYYSFRETKYKVKPIEHPNIITDDLTEAEEVSVDNDDLPF